MQIGLSTQKRAQQYHRKKPKYSTSDDTPSRLIHKRGILSIGKVLLVSPLVSATLSLYSFRQHQTIFYDLSSLTLTPYTTCILIDNAVNKTPILSFVYISDTFVLPWKLSKFTLCVFSYRTSTHFPLWRIRSVWYVDVD